MGVPVPVGRWLRGAHRHVVEEYVLSERALGRGIFNGEYVRELVARHEAGEEQAERLWLLVNFEVWQRRFFDGEVAMGQDEPYSAIAGSEVPFLADQPTAQGHIARHSGLACARAMCWWGTRGGRWRALMTCTASWSKRRSGEQHPCWSSAVARS